MASNLSALTTFLAALALGSGLAAPALAQAVPAPRAEEKAEAPKPPPAPIVPPRLLENAEAAYPDATLAQGRAARVVLEITIDEQGLAKDVKVASPAQPGFDESALQAAAKLKFAPATQGGVPLPVRLQFAFNFRAPVAPKAAPAPTEQPVNLTGTVRERGSRKKLTGVEVAVPAADLSAVTDKEGRFELRGVPAGTAEVVITAPGYDRLIVKEPVAEGQKVEVLYRLQPVFGNPLEATIEGERQRKELSRTSLATPEIQRIPGAQGDALKVVEDLPGVARTSPIGGGLLVIRGSKPGDSLVFLDGEPVPLIYHFGALASTVNPDLLEGIDLLPGNFSVYYGDMSGGLIEVRSRKLRNELHGYANVSLLDASALLEGPTGIEGLTFGVAARRSYFDVILKAVFSSTDVGLSVAPVYYDAQFRLDYKPKGSNHSFGLFALTSKDELGLLFNRPLAADPNVSGTFDLLTSFSQIRGRHQWHSGPWSTDTTAMFEWIALKFDVGQQFFTLDAYDTFLRTTVTREIDDSLTFAAGLDIGNRRARVGAKLNQAFLIREGEFNQNAPPRPDDAQIALTSSSFNRFSPGLWAEARFRPTPKLAVTTGVRGDIFKYSTSSNLNFTFSPRVTARYELLPELAFKGGAGLYTEGARNGDAAHPFGNPQILPEAAWQTTAGFEARPTPGIFISVEGFYKWLTNVISRSDASVLDDKGMVVPEVLNNAGVGRIYGVEVLIRRELSERFFGWIAYSLSRSVRLDRPGDSYRLFDFDQTHALTVIASYKLPRGWQIGGRFRLISGNPETPVLGARYLASADVYLPVFGKSNSSRLPLFHQLDARIDKVWTFDGWTLDLYLDVVNAYNHRAVEGTTYSYDYSQRGTFQGLPLLPSLGLKGSF